MRRAFRVDALQCGRCDGRLHLIAVIEDPDVARRILFHLGLPADPPRPHRPRPPPQLALPDYDDVDWFPDPIDGSE